MQVPFLDLKAQYKSIKPEIDQGIQEVIENTAFVMGKYLEKFETNFAQYQDLKYVIGTNSGTSALAIALLALQSENNLKWEHGKWEAIIPANTFIATAESVIQAGGKPVFVDIVEDTFNIQTNKLREAITENTCVIIPVHLYGQPAEMDKIMQIANEHNIPVIEDCAQAHGAQYKSKNGYTKLGGFGSACAFSFYPGKNLGAYGDGGAVGTNSADIADYIRMYRDHGSKIKYEHLFSGSTDRLDALQGAVLNVKLKYLDEWNKNRNINAKIYTRYLAEIDEVVLPYVPDWADPVWHLYVIRVPDREGLMTHLQKNDIGCGFHYKTPLHLQPAFKYLGYQKGDFPVVERVMSEIISLPMYPELNENQIKYVAEKIKEFLAKRY